MKINECIARVEFNGTQYYFLSEITGGIFGTGKGEEYMTGNRGTYLPMWIDIKGLSSVDVRPKEVATKVQLLK